MSECDQCLAQKRFAGTYASPNEDVLCGFHTSELRREKDAEIERLRGENREFESELIEGKSFLAIIHKKCRTHVVCDVCSFLGYTLDDGFDFTDAAYTARRALTDSSTERRRKT